MGLWQVAGCRLNAPLACQYVSHQAACNELKCEIERERARSVKGSKQEHA